MAAPFRIALTVANRQFPAVLLVGGLLGVANYVLGVYPTLGRSLVLQTVISILMGYPLVVLAAWSATATFGVPRWAAVGGLTLGSFAVGLIASEGQLLADHLLFGGPGYRPGRGGGVYGFNGLLAVVLGTMIWRWRQSLLPVATAPGPVIDGTPPPREPLTRLPLRQGDRTLLVELGTVLYFEAYDNYAFLHDQEGQRRLCNHSLSALGQRLPDYFLRVHRKYLVNTHQIVSIEPHLKGRYVLTLGSTAPQKLRTGASYAEAVRALTKL